MAELGQAELVLTANTQQLEKALAKVRDDLASLDTRPIKLKIDTTGNQGLSNVQGQLRNVSTEADRAAVRVQSLNQVLNQAPGATYTRISAQIARLTSESRQLATSSGDYLKVLQRIVELESIRANRVGRQQVNAQFEAYKSPTLKTGFGSADRLPSLPNTIAADQQRIQELTAKLQNVERGTVAYDLALRQLEQTQNRVARSSAALFNSLQRPSTGFGEFSASIGSDKAVQGSVRRNQEKVAAEAEREGRAREQALRVTQQQLQADLQREQTLRQIAERIKQSAAASEGGFGAASASNFGTSDPTQKSIRRNAEKVAAQEERAAAQRAALEEDLAQQISKRTQSQERIIAEQQKAIAAAKKEVAAAKANAKAKQASAKVEQEATAKRRKDLRKRVGESIGNALIGGAFPALFGQGAGASAGGAVGGGIGGLLGGNFGFGLSLVGTAIGQTVDNLAKALESPVENFDLVKQSALLSSKSLEKYAEGLIATGRVAEADAVIRQDLSKNYGPQNLKSIDELRAKNDELARSWAQLSASIGSLLVGPLSGLANLLNGITGGPTGSADRVSESQFTAELQRIEQQFGRKAASDVARFKFFNNPEGLPSDRQNRAALNYAEKQGYVTDLVAKAKREELTFEEKIRSARKQTNAEYSNSFRLISAQIQGNRSAQLDERSTAVIDRRNQELRALDVQKVPANDARRVEANQTAAKELFRIEEERLQLQKEIAKTIEQEAIKRNQIAEQIGATRARRDAALAQADSAANPGNTTLAARAGELEGLSFLAQNRLRVEQAITSERILQAQYAQESDPTKRAQLAEQITSASYELRLAGEEAGAALAEKAASAAQSLRSAQETLRGTLQSNFKFLPRDQRQSLLASARADIERGRQSGILRPNFGAAGRRRTFEAADFVRNVEQQRGQVAQQQALVDALKENTNAERNIRINVTMNADGSFNVNQTEQQAALL